MKLHTFDRKLAVAKSHDDAIVGFGGDLQAIGKRRGLDDERVGSGCLQRVGQTFEYALIVMVNHRGLAVHDLWGSDDVAPEGVTDALVSKTHAEDGNRWSKFCQNGR